MATTKQSRGRGRPRVKDGVGLNIRIPGALMRRIDETAEAERRSRTGLATILLEEAMAARSATGRELEPESATTSASSVN